MFFLTESSMLTMGLKNACWSLSDGAGGKRGASEGLDGKIPRQARSKKRVTRGLATVLPFLSGVPLLKFLVAWPSPADRANAAPRSKCEKAGHFPPDLRREQPKGRGAGCPGVSRALGARAYEKTQHLWKAPGKEQAA